MANKVFVNTREIACKAAAGKVIASFPDVCLSPPSPPAGPVPIPYPVTSMASDTTGGSKKVKVSGKEVMLKDRSSFKKCTGDEAATKSLGMGVVSHQIGGAVYFAAWSMNVKIEGENAVRHLDLVTSNHGSKPGNTPPWAYIDAQMTASIQECKKEAKAAKTACKDVPPDKQCDNGACKQAKKCLLVSYKQGASKSQKSTTKCCPGEQPHHLIEAHGFYEKGGRKDKKTLPGFGGTTPYDDTQAPCVCAQGSRFAAEHGAFHALQGQRETKAYNAAPGPNKTWKYKEAKTAGINAHKAIFPTSHCSKKCLAAQLDAYHEQVGAKDAADLRAYNAADNMQEWQKDPKVENVIKKMNSDLGNKPARTGFSSLR